MMKIHLEIWRNVYNASAWDGHLGAFLMEIQISLPSDSFLQFFGILFPRRMTETDIHLTKLADTDTFL